MQPAKIENEIKWGVRKRLEMIESELFWGGKINRLILMEKTGISRAQASIDLAQYKSLAPENMIYDLTEKTYLASAQFTPIFISTSPLDCLEHLARESDCAERIPLPHRDVALGTFRCLYSAIQSKGFVRITYQSLNSPEAKTRNIAPHSFVFDGARWHVRAFDFLTPGFRDFLLGRILEVGASDLDETNLCWGKEHDSDWWTTVSLILAPHPGLTKEQKAVVARDYGMNQGQVTFRVRKACSIYVLSRMRLLDEAVNPGIQQVVLLNRPEIESVL